MSTTKMVLVTGASGFIGGAFLRIFGSVSEKIGYHLVPMVRKPTGLQNEVILDFEDRDFGLRVRKLNPVDAIVHLGAKVDFNCDVSELSVPNVWATDILANWAKEIGAYFMFASSVMVYGAKTERTAKDNAVNSDTAYAQSKRMAENAIQASGAKHLVMRLAGVYGNNGSQFLGINRAIMQAQQGIVPTLFGDGLGKRNYLYIVDSVRMMVYWLKSETEGIHLVAGTEIISIADMLDLICDTFLDGQKPIRKDGDSGRAQIVMPSEICWHTRKFEEALVHMKYWHKRGGK